MAQQIIASFAVYFVIWWITLFAVLPFGLRTQGEDEHVILGTVESAPTKFRAWRVVLVTTLVSALLYGAWYVASHYFGLNIDSIPRFVPNYN